MKIKKIKSHFKGKKILITGHTGFKGSWLSLWMHLSGAKVLGISDSIPTKPSHFELLKLNRKISSKIIISEYLRASNFFIEDGQTKYLNALLDKISKKIRTSNE